MNESRFIASYARQGSAKNALDNINWLPLVKTKELAELVGYVFADGSVEHSYDKIKIRPKGADFISDSSVLRNRVRFLFNTVFNVEPKDHLFRNTKGLRLRNAAAARALWLLGIPMGRKVSQYYNVPGWIKIANKEIKSAFIKAYFDCDASKPYKLFKKKATFGIRLTVNKEEEKVSNGLVFLNAIKEMLQEFEVVCNGPYVRKSKIYINKKGVKTIMLELLVQRQQAFLNYFKHIGFTEPSKKEKIKEYAKVIISNTNYRL
ncbi:MAG: hypothetical protein CL943_02890 [Candidatus Diapherotrites archaeon]|uniref:DOD-type homing endonuclease domain-containing protein n=1 Tax=Candidatus Iainarchaeum sp. TaxID=3101447 RepID=A0A2D6M1C7_9ARCH|nr:hypothetical protein [Candidatus Diapherotrites archaeon]